MNLMLRIIFAVTLLWLAYLLGISNSEVKTLIKEKKVIEYVEHKKSKIYIQPNASRDELLGLMRAGKL